MAPRSLWSGSISFGLVNVPVKLYPAIAEHKLHFHLIHEKDKSPIGYQKTCKVEDKPVPDEEIAKAFEINKGEWVVMSDEDFARAEVEGFHTIEISDFVPSEEIDPIFFAKTYFAGPAEGGEHVYALLARAMEASGLIAIAKFVLRERQHLGALRVRDGVITLEQLYFADEIRPNEQLRPSKQRVSKEELEIAARLIESFKGSWQPTKYKDTYRDELCAAIKAKRGGKQSAAPVQPEEAPELDLMEALKASVRRGRGTGGGSSSRRRASPRRAAVRSGGSSSRRK